MKLFISPTSKRAAEKMCQEEGGGLITFKTVKELTIASRLLQISNLTGKKIFPIFSFQRGKFFRRKRESAYNNSYLSKEN